MCGISSRAGRVFKLIAKHSLKILKFVALLIPIFVLTFTWVFFVLLLFLHPVMHPIHYAIKCVIFTSVVLVVGKFWSKQDFLNLNFYINSASSIINWFWLQEVQIKVSSTDVKYGSSRNCMKVKKFPEVWFVLIKILVSSSMKNKILVFWRFLKNPFYFQSLFTFHNRRRCLSPQWFSPQTHWFPTNLITANEKSISQNEQTRTVGIENDGKVVRMSQNERHSYHTRITIKAKQNLSGFSFRTQH